MKRRIPLIAGAVILFFATLAAGFCIGSQYAHLRFEREGRVFKDLVMSYLDADGMLLGNSFFAFDPMDRREDTVVVTGMLRISEPGRTRVGRF